MWSQRKHAFAVSAAKRCTYVQAVNHNLRILVGEVLHVGGDMNYLKIGMYTSAGLSGLKRLLALESY